MLSCQFALIVARILQLYTILMVVYALVSWIPSLRGRWSDYLAMLIEPVLEPIRRIIPPLGGFDLAFLVLFIAVQWLASWMPAAVCRVSY